MRTPIEDRRLHVVPFNLAKLAKEKLFLWPTNVHYSLSLTEKEHPEDGKSGPFGWEKGELNKTSQYFVNNNENIDFTSEDWYHCAAPTLELLRKFIREERRVHIIVERNASGWYWYMVKEDGGTTLGESGRTGPNDGGVWDTHDEALIDAMFIQLHTPLAKYRHWGNYASVAISSFILTYNRKTYEKISNNSSTTETI